MILKNQGLRRLSFWQASLGLLWMCGACQARDFFKQRAQGWHWYEDRKKEGLEVKKKPVSRRADSSKSRTPTRMIEEYKKELEEKLHVALIHPTSQNLIAYMEAQIRGQEMAQRFADEWMKVVYTNPHLDYTSRVPVNHIGQQIYRGQEDKRRSEKLERLAQTHGLFFFFQGDCPYCEAFAPVVQEFSRTYGFKVLAISLDGKALSAFPDFQRDNGISKVFQIRQVPTLLAVEPRQGQGIPLSHGFVSQAEIEKRADALVASMNAPTERRSP